MRWTSVLGIDPSLTGTGICANGNMTTCGGPAKFGDGRLQDIRQSVAKHTPLRRRNGDPVEDALAIVEDLPTHAHGAGKTGMAQGAVRLALLDAGTPYVLISAATLKKFATGKGNASKPDMRMAMYKRADLDQPDDNLVDAWWLYQIGLTALGDPRAVRLPRAQREALFAQSIVWPAWVAERMLQPYETADKEVLQA